VIKNHQMVLNQ